jgi:hypothetical protein
MNQTQLGELAAQAQDFDGQDVVGSAVAGGAAVLGSLERGRYQALMVRHRGSVLHSLQFGVIEPAELRRVQSREAT